MRMGWPRPDRISAPEGSARERLPSSMSCSYRVNRGRVGALLLLFVACDSPSVRTTEEVAGEVTLTAEQSLAAFEVELCTADDAPPEFEGYGSFSAEVSIDQGNAELTLENLEVDPSYEPPAGARAPVEVVSVSDAPNGVGVVLTMNLSGLSAEQCSEPQVVQFSAAGLEEGQTVSIRNIEATFSGEWTNSLCPSDLGDGSLSLEITAL